MMNSHFFSITICMVALLLIIGCSNKGRYSEIPHLTTVNIIDRNGLVETISADERLKQFENVDFMQPQPYQKVLRLYERDCEGNVQSYITSYHPNGQLKQYLEVVNSRAFGKYQEWHENGCLKLESNIIGGTADLDIAAATTWIFDGNNKAWDENGCLEADIYYEKGQLQGTSIYYHPNGIIWQKIPYANNVKEGCMQQFLEDGTLLQQVQFQQGVKNGQALRYWNGSQIAADEYYQKGLLQKGSYFDCQGQIIAEVKDGNGKKAVFGKSIIKELHTYQNGVQEGLVEIFDERGLLIQSYHIKDELKQGEEIHYFEAPPFVDSTKYTPTPKLAIMWSAGKMQGHVRTWYPNGKQESQREMSNNVKNGILTAWYLDGNLMLIEEYDKDKLVKGDYFKRGDSLPVAHVSGGKGVAMLFDAEGNFVRKVAYNFGRPTE